MRLVFSFFFFFGTVKDGTPGTQINQVVSHPTLPIIVTAHEDKYIRVFDSNTGPSPPLSPSPPLFPPS